MWGETWEMLLRERERDGKKKREKEREREVVNKYSSADLQVLNAIGWWDSV